MDFWADVSYYIRRFFRSVSPSADKSNKPTIEEGRKDGLSTAGMSIVICKLYFVRIILKEENYKMRNFFSKAFVCAGIIASAVALNSICTMAAETYADFDFTTAEADGGAGKSVSANTVLASNDYITVTPLFAASYSSSGVKISSSNDNYNIDGKSVESRAALEIKTGEKGGRLTLDWGAAEKIYYFATGNANDGYTTVWSAKSNIGTLTQEVAANTTYTFFETAGQPVITHLKFVEISTEPNVSLDTEKVEVNANGTATVVAIVDNLGDYTFDWKSADDTIATVEGTELADSKSTATITGVAGGKSTTVSARIMNGDDVVAKADVTVDVIEVTEVSGKVDSTLATKGDKVVFFDNALKVEDVAEVDDSGNYKANLPEGTYNITLKSNLYNECQYYIKDATVAVTKGNAVTKNIEPESSAITEWDFTNPILYFDNDSNTNPKLYKAENANGDTTIKGIIITTGSKSSKFHANYTNSKAQVKNITFKVPVKDNQQVVITAEKNNIITFNGKEGGYASYTVNGETSIKNIKITDIAGTKTKINSTSDFYCVDDNALYIIHPVTETEMSASEIYMTKAGAKIDSTASDTVYTGIEFADGSSLTTADFGGSNIYAIKVNGANAGDIKSTTAFTWGTTAAE